MTASELLCWLNAPKTFTGVINRVDDFCDLASAGHLSLTSDHDVVATVATSARAPRPLMLPAAAA